MPSAATLADDLRLRPRCGAAGVLGAGSLTGASVTATVSTGGATTAGASFVSSVKADCMKG